MKASSKAKADIELESSLVVADHIEVMQLGRITAIGLYPDRTLVMHIPSTPIVGELGLGKLTLLLTVKGLPIGVHKVDATIILSNGESKPSNAAPIKIERAGEAVNIVMSFTNFRVPQPGEFKIRIGTSGYYAEQSFWILQKDLTEEFVKMGTPTQVSIAPPKVTKKAVPAKRKPRPAPQ